MTTLTRVSINQSIYSITHLMRPPRILINLSMATMGMETVELGITFVVFSVLELS